MELFGEKLIRGSAHPYTGKEAIAVGVCQALGDNDTSPAPTAATDTAREGARPQLMMAEIMGADRVLPRQGRLDAHHRDR